MGRREGKWTEEELGGNLDICYSSLFLVISFYSFRKARCSDRLYYTTIDGVHITAWFDPR